MELVVDDVQLDMLQQDKQKIDNLDLSAVTERLIKVDGWTPSQAEEGCRQYRRYLYLRKKFPQFDLPPSEDIDGVWHAHILHTKDYFAFCNELFGSYLHHHPHEVFAGRSKSNMQRLFDQTQELHKQEFGDYIYKIPAYLRWLDLLKYVKNKLTSLFFTNYR